jgi:hypothetical protein
MEPGPLRIRKEAEVAAVSAPGAGFASGIELPQAPQSWKQVVSNPPRKTMVGRSGVDDNERPRSIEPRGRVEDMWEQFAHVGGLTEVSSAGTEAKARRLRQRSMNEASWRRTLAG